MYVLRALRAAPAPAAAAWVQQARAVRSAAKLVKMTALKEAVRAVGPAAAVEVYIKERWEAGKLPREGALREWEVLGEGERAGFEAAAAANAARREEILRGIPDGWGADRSWEDLARLVRALSGYNMYVNARAEEDGRRDISKHAAEWRDMSPEARAPYVERARAHERAQQDLEVVLGGAVEEAPVPTPKPPPPPAPDRVLNPYQLFCSTRWKEHKAAGMQRYDQALLAKEWRALSDEDKLLYVEQAQQMSAAAGPAPKRTAAANADVAAPTTRPRSMPVYYYFVQQRRKKLRAEGTKADAAALAAEWRALSDAEKARYKDEARQVTPAAKSRGQASARQTTQAARGGRGTARLTPYYAFLKQRSVELKASGEKFNVRALAAEWNELTPEQKAAYKDVARQSTAAVKPRGVKREATSAAGDASIGACTPYFLFVQRRAAALKAAGEPFDMKALGAEWKELDEEARGEYVEGAAANLERKRAMREANKRLAPDATSTRRGTKTTKKTGSRVQRSETYRKAREAFRSNPFYKTFHEVNWDDHYEQAKEYCDGDSRAALVHANETLWEEFHALAPNELLALIKYTKKEFERVEEEMLNQ